MADLVTTRELAVDALLRKSLAFLRTTWSEERGVFPYSTSLVDGNYQNDYRHPLAVRYTINTLLGLQEEAKAGRATDGEVRAMTERFLSERFDDVTSAADFGLLLVLLQGELERREARTAFGRVLELAKRGGASLHLQDLSWMLWGASVCRRVGLGGAEEAAELLFRRIQSDFVDPETGLAQHSTRPYRRRIVSFGSTVYFLRAMHEYRLATGDEQAAELFARGVRRMIELQGPRGEWPWLFDTRQAIVREIYPVFAVHQDSMAMLFLLPALDAGIAGVAASVERSLGWGFLGNELGVHMYPETPLFMAYRSIERRDPLPRLSRYVRFSLSAISGKPARFVRPESLRVNPECRSYHLGWFLYAWSSRRDLLAASLERARPVGAPALSVSATA